MPRPSHLRSVQEVDSAVTSAATTATATATAARRGRVTARGESYVAAIVEVLPEGLVAVRPHASVGPAGEARLALLPGYAPAVGDLVAILPMGTERLVVAVIKASRPVALVAPDGTTARLVDGHLEVTDGEGHLLVRSVDGGVEVGPARGDLKLRAPGGRVEIEAGLDVAIRAQRDVLVTADRSAETRVGGEDAELASRIRVDGRGATIVGAEVGLRARRTRITAGVAEIIARELKTSATRVETTATDIETTADRVVVRAKNVVEEVAELLETRVGRVRTLVRGVFSLRARSTSMKSKDDTSIDGRRVLLG